MQHGGGGSDGSLREASRGGWSQLGTAEGVREMETAIEEQGIVDGLLPGPKRALVAWDWGYRGREE